MAKPTGYIDISDGGWPVPTRANGSTWIPVDLCVRQAPPAWAGGRYRLEAWSQISVEAGDTLTLSPLWTSIGDEMDFAGPIVATWEELDDAFPPAGPLDGDGVPWDLPLYFDMFEKPTEHKHDLGGLWAKCEAAGDAAEILSIQLITTPENTFANSTPSCSRYATRTARNTDANSWRPYDSGRPASSWLVKWALADTYNRLIFHDTQAWSVPL